MAARPQRSSSFCFLPSPTPTSTPPSPPSSLHTSTRTDLITSRLHPCLRIGQREQLIASRLLTQAEYERGGELGGLAEARRRDAALLLFRGIDAEVGEKWRKADEVDWVQEVEAGEEKFRDEGLFRVLEWGAVEVQG
jgi:hypothetical protein